MGDMTIGVFALLGLIFLLATGMRVAFAITFLGLLALHFWLPMSTLSATGFVAFSSTNSFTLTAVPLFIFMGEILMRSGVGEDLYGAGEVWLSRLPGGLAQANIAVSAVFASICGSSVASAATLGTVAVPSMKSRGYDPRLLFGSLAAGATLGILIPPSVTMIIYGGMTNTSVGHLFIAGVVPGVILALAFMAYIAAWNLRVPGLYPKLTQGSLTGEGRWQATIRAMPSIVICLVMLGSIYGGIVTPTEAAAVGVASALLMALVKRRLSPKVLHDSLMGAMYTTSMALLLLVGCQILSYALNHLGIPQQISELVLATVHSKWIALLIIYAMYLVLGMFIDGISMMILTTPIIYPIVLGCGFSSIWFGVIMTICIEMSLITPPVGMNLYILHGLDDESDFGEISRACVPYVAIMIALMLLLSVFPSIAIWLPGKMR